MPSLKRLTASIYYETYDSTLSEKKDLSLVSSTHKVSSSRWVTMLNGYTRSSRDLRAFARHLNGEGYNVLLMDNRGCGNSSITSSFSHEDMVEDVIALWCHLGITSCHLLGISLGGIICQHLLLNHPLKITSIALISTTDSPVQPAKLPQTQAQALEFLKPYFSTEFADKNQKLISVLASDFINNLATTALQKDVFSGINLQKLYPKELITIPSLIVHGQEDKIVDINCAFTLSKYFQSPQVKIFSHVGHLLLAECPKQLYQTYSDFLQCKSMYL